MIPISQTYNKPWSWRQHLGTLLPLLAVYCALASYGLDRQSLWEDEVRSVERVVSSIPIWKDGHGFLYFALLHLWVKLGTTESILRSLSILLGAGAVCLTYVLGASLLNRRAAVLGTTLLATSPFLIWYSQEVRYITLMLVTTLLNMYAFHRLIARPRPGWWLTYGSTALLAFFSFLSTLLLPLVQGLYLVGSPPHRPLLRSWLVCQVAVFTLFAWWFVNGTHFWQAFIETIYSSQQTLVNNPKLFPFSGDFNNVRPEVIPYTFFALSTGFSLGPPPRELFADQSLAPLVPHAPMLLILSVLYGGLFVFGLLTLHRQRDAGMLLALWIGVPILGAFGIAHFLNIFYDVRYVALVLPAYVLLLAAGIGRFRRPAVQMALLGAILAAHTLALANYYTDARYAREDTRSAARYLESKAGSGDGILVVGTLSSLPYYYKGNLSLAHLPSLEAGSRSLTEQLRELSATYDRLWLVQIRPWEVDRGGKVKAALDGAYKVVTQECFPGVDVYAYQVSR